MHQRRVVSSKLTSLSRKRAGYSSEAGGLDGRHDPRAWPGKPKTNLHLVHAKESAPDLREGDSHRGGGLGWRAGESRGSRRCWSSEGWRSRLSGGLRLPVKGATPVNHDCSAAGS